MSLGADIAAVIPELRAAAESRMRDRCRIEDRSGAKVWNTVTLQYDTAPVVVYEGPCRVRRPETAVRVGEVANQLYAESDATLSLPFSDPTSAAVKAGDVVEVTDCVNDPALVGSKFTINSARGQTDATARRFPVKETQ